jgi:hypothetical protein
VAEDAQESSERSLVTVSSDKHLPKLRQVKEARSLVSELFADHGISPDVAAIQTVYIR